MKRITVAGLIATAITGWLGAQSVPAPSNPGSPETVSTTQTQGSNQFPAGTTIPVELSKALDARKARTGDKIEARIPADVLSHGKIVIPRSGKMIGHVTDVKAHSKESPESRVGMAFDSIVMKDGREMAIQVVVQALARPLQLAMASDSRLSEGGGSASASSGGGGGGSMPPRSTERVADMSSDVPPPTTLAPLASTSQGVVGMKGLVLSTSGQTSVVSSETDNVRLESGAQMILRVQ